MTLPRYSDGPVCPQVNRVDINVHMCEFLRDDKGSTVYTGHRETTTALYYWETSHSFPFWSVRLEIRCRNANYVRFLIRRLNYLWSAGKRPAGQKNFQCPFIPILPTARDFDTARDSSDNGQPRRTRACAPCSLDLHAYKYLGSLTRSWEEPRRWSTPRPTGTCNFIPRDDLLHCAPGSFRNI
ncbi:hypothetical protein EVAR_27946_1 [Eumeta japonica]|uniref:Uncharacterized protein n=1 Tax=Eumeta variegata TaxID=151549 RepID=A0A4C1UV19_EUMVA|nr:hypothetical protein EVAR_27946_1 [Eumeta japonica]